MEENKKLENTDSFLILHETDDAPISLRRAFIASAMGHDGYTKLVVHDGIRDTIYKVRENIDSITGSFAKFGNIKINPAFVSTIRKNRGENADTHPVTIYLNTVGEQSYNLFNSVETVTQTIQAAMEKGPC